ncbi:MAG: galactokinase [Treponema sp.]|nr:galactokinase [Treponema sp.]
MECIEQVNDAHKSEYEVLPDVTAAAPGRFHLIGEHSWFFKDKTLSMAINLLVHVAVSKRSDFALKFYFPQLGEKKRANLSSIKFRREDRWANAVKAIIYGYASGGFEMGGVNVTVYSDILPSAGFGITTAIKVASAIALKKLFNIKCSDAELLQVIERGNKLFLETGNYIADNFSALFSKAGKLLVTDHARASFDYIDYPFKDKLIMLTDARVPRISVWNETSIYEPQNALLLGELHELKKSVYGGWKYESNVTDVNEVLSVVSEDTRRRLLCIMREHGDVLNAREALKKNDFGAFARAINHSHESMKELFEISCPEIDWILKRVGELEPNLEQLSNPVTCGRITGKGFGRCLYAFMRRTDEKKFKEKLNEYERIFGFHPSTYEVLPSDGAHIVKN